MVALIEAGHDVLAIDDLSNSFSQSLTRVKEITGTSVPFHVIDVLDTNALRSAMATFDPGAVIHFAAHKHVDESIMRARDYYRVNVGGLLSLIEAMESVDVRQLIYSSSGSIYGNATTYPIPETATPNPTNPYSRTKLMGEQILQDVCASDPRWSAVALRYFNPAGAHPSGLIGEDPLGLRTNLLPVLLDVAIGVAAHLTINGNDYPTPDGSAVRDYVHVVDVADAHIKALGLGPVR